MFFADFTKLKIITDYNFLHHDIHLKLSQHSTIKEIRDIFLAQLNALNLKLTTLPVLYDCYCDAAATDDIPEVLEQCARIMVPTLLQFLETGESYQRERRLDVPDKLKPLHASYGCIKRACNNQIKTPVINIRITINDLSYYFCMGRDIDTIEQKETSNE